MLWGYRIDVRAHMSVRCSDAGRHSARSRRRVSQGLQIGICTHPSIVGCSGGRHSAWSRWKTQALQVGV